jgi:hypothetical protein
MFSATGIVVIAIVVAVVSAFLLGLLSKRKP